MAVLTLLATLVALVLIVAFTLASAIFLVIFLMKTASLFLRIAIPLVIAALVLLLVAL